MFVPYRHESIRLTGRWDVRDESEAVCTATGSYLEFCFEGKMAVAQFNTLTNDVEQRLHLWIQVDGGVMTEAPIDRALRVICPEDGIHTVRIIYKGGQEATARWYAPLRGKVSFMGIKCDKPVAIAPDTRRTIEFIGDSITEGVLIDNAPFYENDLLNRPYQDDVCATYAWRTAEALDLRPIFMGYGAVGLTKSGSGKVPPAALAYPYNFDGSPITHTPSDVVLINHGANDRGRNDPVLYCEKYLELVRLIRAKNPDALIVALSAFCGAYHEELGAAIADYNRQNGCVVHYIDTFGWISPEPLHPTREGHTEVARRLIPILREILQEG